MEDLSEIERTLTLREDDGTVILRVGLIFTVYFRQAYKPEVRAGVLEAVQMWLRTVAGQVAWARRSETKWQRFRDDTPQQLENWVSQRPSSHEWSIALHGGEKSADASGMFLRVLGNADWTPQHILSHFSLGFPLTWFADHPGSFPAFCQELCSILRPLSGYAGIGIARPNGAMEVDRAEPAVYAIAQRFPGLEVDVPAIHDVYIGDCIKGVNWLTVLGTQLVERFGGDAKLSHALPPAASILPFKGGVIVKSGPQPRLGDSNVNRMPDDYVAVNRVLRSLRASDTGAFHHANDGKCFDREASLAWLARFD
jgi:hypothetical protein